MAFKLYIVMIKQQRTDATGTNSFNIQCLYLLTSVTSVLFGLVDTI